jgi:predicted CopG family antitoxin
LVKTLTIRDEVYRKLLAVKAKDQSFSELLEQLTEGTKSIEVLTSIRARVEFRDKERMMSELSTSRAERRI